MSSLCANGLGLHTCLSNAVRAQGPSPGKPPLPAAGSSCPGLGTPKESQGLGGARPLRVWEGVRVPQEGPQRRAVRWAGGIQGRDLRGGLESPWGLLRLDEPAQKVTASWVFPPWANCIFAKIGKHLGRGLEAWFQKQLCCSLPLGPSANALGLFTVVSSWIKHDDSTSLSGSF